MASDRDDRLPPWLLWSERPFPDTNLLLLPGRHPAMIDSGLVGHADQTAERASAQLGQVELVVNTHWHSDHVGGNARMQSAGAGIEGSLPDSETVNRRDPGCCVAEYLDQPVAAHTVDQALSDNDTLHLGDTEWEVIATPGHTQGHLCLWQPEDRILAVGDALLDYDVGWVNIALDGPRAAATALASLQRLPDLGPALVLPAHGPLPAHPDAALQAAFRRQTARRRPRRRRMVRRPPRLRLRHDDLRRHPRRRPRPVPARPRLVHRRRPAAPPLPRRPGQRTRPLHDKQQRHRHHRRQGRRCSTAPPWTSEPSTLKATRDGVVNRTVPWTCTT